MISVINMPYRRTIIFIFTLIGLALTISRVHAANVSFTLAAWVNPSTSIATKALIVKNSEIRLVTNASGNVGCQFNNGSDWQSAATSTAALALSSWQHVACTYDGDELRVYVNGASSGREKVSSDVANTANVWRFGDDASNAYGDYNGKMDEVRVYNRALQPREIALLYDSAPGGYAWMYHDWLYRKKLTIDSTKIDADLTDFPVAVTLSSSNFTFARARGNGEDIRFTDKNGIPLNYEIEKWDSTGQSAVVWVKIPTVEEEGDTDFFLYYGNAGAPDSQNKTAVWSNGYVGVWHLGEGDSTAADFYKDSTINANHGTLQDTDGDDIAATGKVDGAIDFVGNAASGGDLDWIQAGTTNVFNGTGVMTVEAWIKQDNYNKYNSIIERQEDANGWGFTTISDAPAGRLRFTTAGVKDYFSTGTVADTNWHHVAATYDSSFDAHFYIDGAFNSTDPHTAGGVATTITVGIGSYYGRGFSPRFFDGLIDEARVSNVVRSDAWIKADYNSGNDTLLTYGGEEQGSAVAYWKLDEGFGTTAFDQSVNSNDLTLSAASWTLSGKTGRAWNGTGARWMSRADDADFDFAESDDFSVSLWFKSDSASNPGATEYLVDKESSSAGYAIYAETDGDIVFGIDDDATWTPDDTAGNIGKDIYDATWHHIVAVKASTTAIRLYVDGAKASEDTAIAAIATLANSDSLVLGDRDATDNGDEFNGDLDEVKIYRYTLNDTEVALEYNHGKTLKLGSLSTDSDGKTWTDSASREYCIPGDTATCNAPVGEWKLDEKVKGDSKTVYDTSGNGNNGTTVDGANNTGMDCAVRGKIGGGCEFDGADDYVSVSSGHITTSNDWTVAGWIKPNTVSGAAHNTLFVNGDDLGFGGVSGVISLLRVTAPIGNLGVTVATGADTETDLTSANALPLNTWTHIAVSKEGTSLRLYINGAQDNSTTLPSATMDYSANAPVTRIGARSDGAGNFNGLIDEVRIYDYARTPAQIAWDYMRGKPVAHYKMDECQGGTFYDSGGYGRSGGNNASATTTQPTTTGSNTNAGTCTSGNTAHAWYNGRVGKRNYSFDFDGTDDMATTTNASLIDFNEGLQNGFTIGAWVYVNSDGENDVGQIFQKGASTYFRVDSQASGRVDLEASLDLATADATLNIASAIPINEWHHVAVSWTDDSDDEITIWIDGVNRGSSTNGSGAPAADTFDLKIGGDGGANFDGQMDEFKIFNFELTDALVKSVMNDGAVRFGPTTGDP